MRRSLPPVAEQHRCGGVQESKGERAGGVHRRRRGRRPDEGRACDWARWGPSAGASDRSLSMHQDIESNSILVPLVADAIGRSDEGWNTSRSLTGAATAIRPSLPREQRPSKKSLEWIPRSCDAPCRLEFAWAVPLSHTQALGPVKISWWKDQILLDMSGRRQRPAAPQACLLRA